MVHVSAKNRKNASVQLNYMIHIEEIKPWPPSQSLKSLRSVLIQWEHGDRHSGTTSTVVPTIGTVVGEGKIEFNESFRLPVTLVRDPKAKDGDVFKKNRIEFNLCESRRDKAQLLATAVIDLADYGVVKDTTSATAPMKSTRSFTNSSQPVLFIKIQPVRKGHPGSKVQDRPLSRGVSLDTNGGDSVSALMNEEYGEEAELSTFTDDDVSSHSSINNGGLPAHEKNGQNGGTDSNGGLMQEHAVRIENITTPQENLKGSSSRSSSSVDLSSDPGSPLHGHVSVVKSLDSNSSLNPSNEQRLQSSSSHASDVKVEEAGESRSSDDNGGLEQVDGVEIERTKDEYSSSIEDMNGRDYKGTEQTIQMIDGTLSLSADIGMRGSIMKPDRLKNVRSVRSVSDSGRSNGGVSRTQLESKEVDVLEDDQNSVGSMRVGERKGAKIYPKDASATMLDGKMQQLEHKIKVLEGELREAAAIEASLYSVVAEHGSSISKVHAPARRLSRMYLHVSGDARRASAARTAVSGLVLVAKSCGNDVPRLTFWLSNSVVLRAIISKAMDESKEMNGGEKRNKVIPSLTSSRKGKGSAISGNAEDWENPHTFISALERVEAWIFSRTVESIWWQTLTPHMQSAATKGIDKALVRSSSSCDQAQGNFSLELWKNAFKDACERLCPVRAGGHECGCLPELARQVMEQCVARLDVAMFNAILRESDEEIPTDPVSDPISDARVLPIAAGISSFGAGAQLKNAIGNWSRWLTDLFGLDDDDADPREDYNDDPDEDDDRQDTSFKSFYLLNALSDLMMLPKDLLLSRTIRKEVCPTFGTPLIKRILYSFVSDEFCPDPVPKVVLEALESEDNAVAEEGCVTTIPCIAASPVYLPLSSASVTATIGELGNQSQLRRSGSSVLRKAYTSDDELDELKSPLASIFPDMMSRSSSPGSWKLKEVGQNPVRYDLLREIWKNS